MLELGIAEAPEADGGEDGGRTGRSRWRRSGFWCCAVHGAVGVLAIVAACGRRRSQLLSSSLLRLQLLLMSPAVGVTVGVIAVVQLS